MIEAFREFYKIDTLVGFKIENLGYQGVFEILNTYGRLGYQFIIEQRRFLKDLVFSLFLW